MENSGRKIDWTNSGGKLHARSNSGSGFKHTNVFWNFVTDVDTYFHEREMPIKYYINKKEKERKIKEKRLSRYI